MSKRPSIADILAAARTADGTEAVGSGKASTASNALEKTDRDAPEKHVTREEDEAANSKPATLKRDTSPDVIPTGLDHELKSDVPPSILGVLRSVRAASGGAQDEQRPLVDLSEARAPISIARVLADVRGKPARTTSDGGVHEVRTSSRKSRSPAGPAGGSRTSDILSAARRQGAPGENQSAKSNLGETPPRANRRRGESKTASILAAARNQGAAGTESGSQTGSRAAAALGGEKSKTAAILAAARKQGGVTSESIPATKSKGPVTARESNDVKTRRLAATGAESTDDAFSGERPVSVLEILSRVRCEMDSDLALSEYPPVPQMIAELRRLSGDMEKPSLGAMPDRSRTGFFSWIGTLWGDDDRSHHGASI